MIIDEVAIYLSNKLDTLNKAMSTAVALGDIGEIDRISQEISQVEAAKLRLLG